MTVRGTKKRWVAIAFFAALALTLTATAALAATPFNVADFSGYAAGAIVHADALATGTSHTLDAEEALSAASVRSKGLAVEVLSEFGRVVSPNLGVSKKTHGQGSGLELGLTVDPATANQLELQKSEAAAPANSGLITNELLGLPASPLAYASVLRGQAEANWSDSSTCVIGKDLSNGLGYAAHAQLVETGTTNDDGTLGAPLIGAEAPNPDRQVAFSRSHMFMQVQQDEAGQPKGLAFGVASQVIETIAPITLFKGTPNETTIEFLGPWVLTAFAGGIPGTSWVHYGPGQVSPETSVIKIVQAGQDAINVTLQQILGDTGLNIPIPGIADISIGEAPRKIGGAFGSAPDIAADGTSAAAAVDVVRVKLLDGSLADIRVGHMEVSTRVPSGGIDCGVPVTKTATPKGVGVGQAFVVSIAVQNPFGCDMTAVKLVDVITTQGSAKFQVLATSPAANAVPSGANLDSGTIVWNDIGPIAKGATKTVTATIRAQGGGGIIEDIATATATLGNCEGEGNGSQLVGSSLPLQVPVVLAKKLVTTGVADSAAILAGLALMSIAAVSLRIIRRTTV
jgi:hypothetical protein